MKRIVIPSESEGRRGISNITKQKSPTRKLGDFCLRYRWELHPRIEVLQTSALLLGYGTAATK